MKNKKAVANSIAFLEQLERKWKRMCKTKPLTQEMREFLRELGEEISYNLAVHQDFKEDLRLSRAVGKKVGETHWNICHRCGSDMTASQRDPSIWKCTKPGCNAQRPREVIVFEIEGDDDED